MSTETPTARPAIVGKVDVHHLSPDEVDAQYAAGAVAAWARLGPVTIHGDGETIADQLDHLAEIAAMFAGQVERERRRLRQAAEAALPLEAS